MTRYVILRSPESDGLPVGVAVELPRAVLVFALDEYALPLRITEPYRVAQRDLSEVVYEPGDPGYFEQVMVELSRVVSVAGQREAEIGSADDLERVLREEVLQPRLESMRRPYAPSGTGGRFYRSRGECAVAAGAHTPASRTAARVAA